MPATTNDTISVVRGLIPMSLAASRLLDTARTARPYQLRGSHHQRPTIKTAAIRKNSPSPRRLKRGPTTIASCSQDEDVECTSADHTSKMALVSMTPTP